MQYPSVRGDVEVSVVVPTYRRPELLDRCLTALLRQDFEAHRFEILVADDDPDERRSVSLQASLQWKRRSVVVGPDVRYVPARRRQGPAGARNRGWRAARASVIAFTDDDTIPEPTWLSAGWSAMQEGWDAVAGTIRMPLPPRPTDYERDATGLSRAEFATANCFVRLAALHAVGGFDERFTEAWREDSDLQFALLEHGFKCGRAPEAIVVHPIRSARWGVSVSQQRKVRFDALLFKKHRRLYRSRIRRVPPWRYYATVGALVVSAVGWLAGTRSVAVVGLFVWLALTWQFFLRRMAGNSGKWSHVLEMILTSIAIPPLAVFWRLCGAARYRVLFL